MMDQISPRTVWDLGDYHRFATTTIWDLGEILVAAAQVRAGQHVLDVAAGTGNTALRAAATGADVVACDLAPTALAVGRKLAEEQGLTVTWDRADVEELPYHDDAFDVVLSSVGAMWAPRHRAAADEMVRVCRPGGLVAMVNFAAGGLIEDFLGVFAPFMPNPSEDAHPPALWGDEVHVRGLFGDRVRTLDLSLGTYVERVKGGPEGYCALYRETFGPVVGVYDSLAARPEDRARLDRSFLDFAHGANRGAPGQDAEIPFEYALVLAQVA